MLLGVVAGNFLAVEQHHGAYVHVRSAPFLGQERGVDRCQAVEVSGRDGATLAQRLFGD